MKGFKKDGKFRPFKNRKAGVSKSSRLKRQNFEHAKIQSLIFSNKKFTNTTALEWASDHGYKAVKVEPTKNTIRIRQFSPNKIKFGTECRTIQFGGSGVQGVLCETPDRFKHDRHAKLTTSLGAIISPPKKPTATLLKQVNADLDFRDKIIESNLKIKEEIKADPTGEFTPASREEFKENAKEIKQLTKEIKGTFKDIPKDEREHLDRELINRLRVLR